MSEPLRIFVCYRREETSYAARLLANAIDHGLPDSELFIDVDRRAIAIGENWKRRIESAIDASDVVIALIGDQWLAIADVGGGRKIDNSDDPVRLELEQALGSDRLVVPVLFDDARMPRASELPESISDFVFRQNVELRNRRWDDDVREFIASLEQARPELERRRRDREEAARAAALEQAEGERLAREQAEEERLARELAERELLAEQQAAQERIAPEEADGVAREQTEQKRLAAEQAERERLAEQKATEERIGREEADRVAREQTEQKRLAAEQAERERLAQEQAEERLAREDAGRQQAERERVAGEMAERARKATTASGRRAATEAAEHRDPEELTTLPRGAPRLPRAAATWSDRRLLVGLGVAALALGAVVAAVVLVSGGEEPPVPSPTSLTRPAIKGSARVGRTLTGSSGSWTGSPTTFQFQWQRCNASGKGCTAIQRAIRARYRVTNDDVGRRLRVAVTASNTGGSLRRPSAVMAAVPQPPKPPSNTERPTVSGTTQVGSTLTATKGIWQGALPMTFAYVWKRCEADGDECVTISEARSTSYTLRSSDSGSTIRVEVRASNHAGKRASISTRTAVITEPPPEEPVTTETQTTPTPDPCDDPLNPDC